MESSWGTSSPRTTTTSGRGGHKGSSPACAVHMSSLLVIPTDVLDRFRVVAALDRSIFVERHLQVRDQSQCIAIRPSKTATVVIISIRGDGRRLVCHGGHLSARRARRGGVRPHHGLVAGRARGAPRVSSRRIFARRGAHTRVFVCVGRVCLMFTAQSTKNGTPPRSQLVMERFL